MNLEARYRRLLHLYPPEWRERREDEMVATYLDAAPPEATRPSTRDGLDVAVGALGAWSRVTLPALAGGARIAGLIALSAVGALAALLFFGVETAPLRPEPNWGFSHWGPFQTVAAPCWLAWMAIAVAAPFLRGPWARRAGLLAQLGTGALILVDQTTAARPERLILLAMVVTGGTALLYVRGGPVSRVLPVLSTVAGVVIGATTADGHWYGFVLIESEWLRDTGLAVAAAALTVLVVSGLRRRAEGAWALVLLAPAMWALAYSEVTMWLAFGHVPGGFEVFDGFLLGVGVLALLVAAARLAMRLRRRAGDPQAS